MFIFDTYIFRISHMHGMTPYRYFLLIEQIYAKSSLLLYKRLGWSQVLFQTFQ